MIVCFYLILKLFFSSIFVQFLFVASWWAYVAFLFVPGELGEAGCPELTPIVSVAGKVAKVSQQHWRTLGNTREH